MRKTDIVVGVDGSAASREALYWAAREAHRWRADLHVVTVEAGTGPSTQGPTQRSDEDRLERMVSDARRLEPSVRITGHSIRGGVVAALRETSNRCRMLVLGSRGMGGFGRLTLGSTSERMAIHATVPVVVVRGRHGSEESPIVIGVDGSTDSEHALAAGLDEARLRGCGVIATFAYGHAEHPWLSRDNGADPGLLHGSAYAAVETTVTPWRDKFPRVSVEILAADQPPVPVLVALSGHAQLVVVGAQGHDPSESIGSVPLRLMHRAHCPVMIAR